MCCHCVWCVCCFFLTVTLLGVGHLDRWTANTSMSETNKAYVPVFCAEGEQHMHVPYVYNEIGGWLLVNRLFDTQRTHTCHVNRMPNPSFVHCSSWPLSRVKPIWITWWWPKDKPAAWNFCLNLVLFTKIILLFILSQNCLEIFPSPPTPESMT